MSTVSAAPAEWVSGCAARRLTGWSWYQLHRHVILGKVAVQAEPGCTIRYRRSDLERIAAERAPREAKA